MPNRNGKMIICSLKILKKRYYLAAFLNNMKIRDAAKVVWWSDLPTQGNRFMSSAGCETMY